MIDTHTKPSEQTTFARSHREATGYHIPARRFTLYREEPTRNPDRPVIIVCILGFVVLMLVAGGWPL